MSFAVARAMRAICSQVCVGFGRGVDADRPFAVVVVLGEARDHAGLRAAGHRGDEDVVEDDAELGLLVLDLFGPPGEAESAEGMVRRARRDGVGLAAAVLDLA